MEEATNEKLGDPNLFIMRKFRWTVEGAHLPPYWNKTVHFDYMKKIITLEVMCVVLTSGGMSGLDYWNSIMQTGTIPDDTLTFTTYLGDGHPIYEHVFSNLEVIGATSEFDYASDKDVSYTLKIKYGNLQNKALL